MKVIYDSRKDIRLTATGSASPALEKGSTDSGTGRWSILKIPTMSFYEYCRLLQLEEPILPENLKLSELVLSDDDTYAQRMLREDVVDKVIKRDVLTLFNIYLAKPMNVGSKGSLKGKSKIFIADAAIRNAVLMIDDVLSDEKEPISIPPIGLLLLWHY